MATSVPSSPARRKRGYSIDEEPSSGSAAASPRMVSAQIPRTYSGLYGAGAPPIPDFHTDHDDGGQPPPLKIKPPSPRRHHRHVVESNLLPFELSRNSNTDWLSAGGPTLLVTYLLVIAASVLTILAYVPDPAAAWTVVNALHGLVSLVYLHWIKGNPGAYADGSQGEMNAMTCWEQIVSKPAASHLRRKGSFAGGSVSPRHRRSLAEAAAVELKKLRSRDVLCVVPTLLAHAACRAADYRRAYALVNVGVWAVVMLAKVPAMNGVRILGINRTVGIDDDGYFAEEGGTDDESEEGEEEAKKHR